MDHNDNSIIYPDQKIVDREMSKEVKTSFIDYSMSVITSRALPDVRDGMKPGQRRIMYAMFEDHLTNDKPFRKSATTVGNVLGRYHPHGDTAVYGTMVRMAQPFSLRYPLVEGHGNFGNVDGDGAAAYRYTEARMSKIAAEMMADIDKNVVEFVPNFDNSRREPTVLPSRFPNLLVNGSVGIAVGMATYIPPHNLGEVIDATIYRMDNPESSVADLMQYIKGPDFPTKATIYGTQGIIEAYTTGRGRVMVRARARIEEEHRRIVITEIPYAVNKSMLIEAMANLVKDKRIEGITEIRDESGRGGMRIVVEYRRDANASVILNQLYKYTQLEDTCAVNMLALVGGEPKILSLPEILDNYIVFQEDVITRRTKFDLEKALHEAHILEGYKIAIDNIDEVVAIMKTSPSIPASKATLCERFGLSDEQSQAIVDMTLGKLTGLERQKVEDRLAALEKLIADYRAILADVGRIKQIIKDEMLEIKRKYGDPRLTEIVPAEDEIILEDLIERHTCVITLTHDGYIKRQRADVYTSQRRGGKGIMGMATKDEDAVENVIISSSHAYLMLFTNTGKVHMRKAYMIPEAGRTAKGSNLVNILQLADGEKVTAVIPVLSFKPDEYLTMVTKRGIIKRTLLTEYEYQRKGGKIALTLDEGDELLFVMLTHGECDVIVASAAGNAVRFSESNVRAMGRTARGVIGIRLDGDDYVSGAAKVEEGKMLLTLTENGLGKRTDFDDFREMKNRGGRGVVCQKISERTGRLIGIGSVSDGEDIMIITDEGTIIRTPVDGISKFSRTASGVIIMRLADNTKIVNFAILESDAETEKELSEAQNENEKEVKESQSDKTETGAFDDGIESENAGAGESGDDM